MMIIQYELYLHTVTKMYAKYSSKISRIKD